MTRLDELRDESQAALREEADLLYRRTGTFQLGPHSWPCWFSVRDPSKVKADELARLQLFASTQGPGVTYRDLRTLRVHPDDTIPFPGATIPWDDGTLHVLEWSQASDFTGVRVGTCVLRRP